MDSAPPPPAAGATATPAAVELPDECWELVFQHLGDSRPCWQSLSLTCKRFLHISNATRRSLAVTSLCASLPGGLPRILARFQGGLRDIDLSRYHMPSSSGVNNSGGGGNTGTTTTGSTTTTAATTTTVCLARPLEAVAQAELPRLRALNLQGQRGPLPWDALAALGARLRELNISRFQGLRNHDLALVARALPGLEKLDISYPQLHQSQQHGGNNNTTTNMVSDRGVQVMAAGLKRLRSLNLSGHPLLTDAAMEALAARCRELEELTVFDCVNVTDRGLQVLAVHCLKLTTLAVNGRRVTAAGIEGVISSTSKRLLCLKLCHMNLTDEALEQLTDPAAATGGAAGAWYAPAAAAAGFGTSTSYGAGAAAGPGSSTSTSSSLAAAASTTTFSSSYYSSSSSSTSSSVMSVSVDTSDTESLPDSSSSSIDSPAGSTTSSSSSGGGFDAAGFSSPASGTGMAMVAAAAHHHHQQHHHNNHHHPHHLEPAWTSPLTKLVLAYCKGLTSAGLLRVARGCPHIRHLDLEGAHFLRDHHAVALVKCFPDLTFLRLNHCSLLTDTTFTAVLHHCPMLDTLEMEATAVGWGTTSSPTTPSSPSPATAAAEPAKQFHNLRHLKLAWNRAVGDELLARVAAACPALRSLDLSNSLPVTGAGLATLGRACPNLTRLLLNGCKNVHSLEGVLEHTGMIIESRCTMSENQGRLLESCAPAARRGHAGGHAHALALCDQLDRVGFRLLDHLELGHSGFTDAGLLAVARHSRNLLHLSLEGCKISDGGLKSVMDECKHLQCLNLKDCIGITGDALAWMVFCRASLRHLVLPCVSVSEGERARLTRHGCELLLIKP